MKNVDRIKRYRTLSKKKKFFFKEKKRSRKPGMCYKMERRRTHSTCFGKFFLLKRTRHSLFWNVFDIVPIRNGTERIPRFLKRFIFLKKGFYDFGMRSWPFQLTITNNGFHCFTKMFSSGNYRKEYKAFRWNFFYYVGAVQNRQSP